MKDAKMSAQMLCTIKKTVRMTDKGRNSATMVPFHHGRCANILGDSAGRRLGKKCA